MKNFFLSIVFLLAAVANSQNDTAEFTKMKADMESFKIDTSNVPNDKLSDAIKELRKIRGAFNINTIVEFKIAEERSKKKISEEQIKKFEFFLKEGNGKKWLDNAVIWIYRNQFTYDEVIDLQQFYKTSAGKKMASSFPIIIFQSLKAAEMITVTLTEKK